MDRLDMAIELIREARDESVRYLKYREEYGKAKNWAEQNEIAIKYTPRPSKALVNANLKVARRILAQEYIK